MAAIEDRDRLFHNSRADPVIDLSVALAADSNFRHSTDALLANETVEHVGISLYESFSRRWPTEKTEILAFFRAIGRIPKLKSLRVIAMSFGFPLELSSSLLVETLRYARRLERFRIHGVAIRFEETGGDDLAAAFRGHPCLSEVSFVRSLFLQGEENNDAVSYQAPFLAALASIPQLEHSEFHYRRAAVDTTTIHVKKPQLPLHVLVDFSQAPKLTNLEVFNCEIEESHLQALAASFANFEALEELSLSCPTFGLKGCQAVAQILATNPSSLQQIYLEPQKGCRLDAECTDLIANALTHNQQLRVFVLEGPLVASLTPFVEMLRVNCRLEVLTIKASQSSCWEEETEINYLLKLNEIGRYALFHEEEQSSSGTARAKWIQAILDVQGDIHCLYYLLSANPLLCQPSEAVID